MGMSILPVTSLLNLRSNFVSDIKADGLLVLLAIVMVWPLRWLMSFEWAFPFPRETYVQCQSWVMHECGSSPPKWFYLYPSCSGPEPNIFKALDKTKMLPYNKHDRLPQLLCSYGLTWDIVVNMCIHLTHRCWYLPVLPGAICSCATTISVSNNKTGCTHCPRKQPQAANSFLSLTIYVSTWVWGIRNDLLCVRWLFFGLACNGHYNCTPDLSNVWCDRN